MNPSTLSLQKLPLPANERKSIKNPGRGRADCDRSALIRVYWWQKAEPPMSGLSRQKKYLVVWIDPQITQIFTD